MKKDNEKNESVSRRDFLGGSASAAVLASLATATTAEAAGRTRRGKPRVVLIRDRKALDDRGRIRAKVVARMLDQAVCSITGKKAADAAWRGLLRPADRLGIKTNVWSYLPTPPAVENAIKRRARGVGIPASKIKIDDRGARTSLASCTALINARPLRSHHWAGVGGCIKNYIMFVESPASYHPDTCADLGAVWKLPIVAGKTRLNVLVMLTPLYHGRGAHHYSSKYIWTYGGLLVSTDPVAADAVGVKILEAKRELAFGKPRPFAGRTKHVEVADRRHGIGVSDLKKIELIKLGDKKGILI